jgi:hypothetical protein
MEEAAVQRADRGIASFSRSGFPMDLRPGCGGQCIRKYFEMPKHSNLQMGCVPDHLNAVEVFDALSRRANASFSSSDSEKS